MPERRETADRLLCKLVQQRRMPVLGIGLGMQELNVVYGGGIYLHLPEDMPRGIPHRDPQGGAHRHTVVMEPGTRMEEIYGQGEIRVNSYHHQGIRKLAPDFRVGGPRPRRPDRGVRGEGPELVGRRRAVAPRERGEHLARHAADRGLRRRRRQGRPAPPRSGRSPWPRPAESSVE